MTLMSEHTRYWTLALLLSPLWSGCELEPSDGPQLTIYQIDADQACWRRCQGVATIAPSGSECGSTCNFESGNDHVLVVAEYDGLEFGRKVAPPDPELEFWFDNNPISNLDKLNFDGAERRYAAATIRMPASSSSTVQIRVGSGYESLSDSWASTPPSFDLALESCDQVCILAAGVGTAKLVLRDSPRILDVTNATIVERIDGVLYKTTENGIALGAGEQVTDLTIPDRPFTTWQIQLQAGEFVSAEIEAELVAPRPLELSVSDDLSVDCDQIDFDTPLLAAVRGEPEESCRQYAILVHAPDRPQGAVTLTVNAGQLAGGGHQTMINLDADGCAVVPFELPEPSKAPEEINITAEASGLLSASRTWTLDPSPVRSGELFAPGGVIEVGMSGTKKVEISGNLTPPVGGTLHPDTPVAIVISATSDGAVLICGASLPTENIDCNTEGIGGGPNGGCQLSPSLVIAHADGSFDFELDPGICFSGTVEISLYGDRTPGMAQGQCLLHTAIEPQTLLDTEIVTYVPAPPPSP
jgi:hypothetical protein